jgi:hypothetical protein
MFKENTRHDVKRTIKRIIPPKIVFKKQGVEDFHPKEYML